MARPRHLLVKLLVLIIFAVMLLHLFNLGDHTNLQLSKHKEKRTVHQSPRYSERVRCKILLGERGGRMGNRLFMFATALGLALTHSCYLHISAEIIHELKQSFALDLKRLPIVSGLNPSGPRRKFYNHCT